MPTAQRASDWIGIAGLYSFALCAIASISGANIGLTLMTLALVMQFPAFWRRAHNSPLVWLILACLAYAAISATVAGSVLPDTANHQLNQLNKWGPLVLVIVVAWWLKDDPRRLHVALLLFATGVVIRMAMYFPWKHAGAVLQGKDGFLDFGLWHTSFSTYLGTIVIASAVFAPRLLKWTTRSYLRIGLLALLIAVALLAMEVILLEKSRGAWIAIAVTFPPLLFLYVRSLKSRRRAPSRRYVTLAVVAVLAFLSIAVLLQKGWLSQRAFSEKQTWHDILEGDLAQVPHTSIGTRIYLYRFGFEHWLEKPWFGWGTGSEDHLMELAGYRPDVYMPPHFHNIVLEALVRFGVVGFALGAAIVWMVYRSLWLLYHRGRLAPDWYYFLMGMLAFNLVWGMFDIRVIRWDYRDYFLLLFGAAMALSPPFREQALLDKLAPDT